MTRARRLIAQSYALEDRLRATGHLAVGAVLSAPAGRGLARGQRVEAHLLVGRPDHHRALRGLAQAAARERQETLAPLGDQDLAAFRVQRNVEADLPGKVHSAEAGSEHDLGRRESAGGGLDAEAAGACLDGVHARTAHDLAAERLDAPLQGGQQAQRVAAAVAAPVAGADNIRP